MVDTSSRSCPTTSFGISDAEPSGSTTTVTVNWSRKLELQGLYSIARVGMITNGKNLNADYNRGVTVPAFDWQD